MSDLEGAVEGDLPDWTRSRGVVYDDAGEFLHEALMSESKEGDPDYAPGNDSKKSKSTKTKVRADMHSVKRAVNSWTNGFDAFWAEHQDKEFTIGFLGEDRYFIELIEAHKSMQTKNLFREYIQNMFEYYKRKRGGDPEAMQGMDIVPLQRGMTRDHWKLFTGLDRSESEYGYDLVDTLMEEFADMDANQIRAIKTQRHKWKIAFLGDSPWKELELNGHKWVIHRDYTLPWMIPTEWNWYNPKAIRPNRLAYTSEATQSARLIDANEKIFKKYKVYKTLVRLHIELETRLTHPSGYEQSSLMTFWHQGGFCHFKPAYDVCVVPYKSLNYCIVLRFQRANVDGNLDKVFVPLSTTVTKLCGEVRPCDLLNEDGNALEFAKKHQPKANAQKEGRFANLVITNFATENRPGVGNDGYMSNNTCLEQPFFQLGVHEFGNGETNIVQGSDYVMKYATLDALKDITGRDIVEWHQSFISAAYLNPTDFMSSEHHYFFPVEFKYVRNPNVQDNARTPIACTCMSRCSMLKPADRSQVKIVDTPAALRSIRSEWDGVAVNKLGVDARLDYTAYERLLAYFGQFGVNAEKMSSANLKAAIADKS